MHFVGLNSFLEIFGHITFRTSLVNTLYWILSVIFIHTPLGLLMALILSKHPPGWKIYRTIFFLPNVISATALAFLWYFIFHVDLGFLAGYFIVEDEPRVLLGTVWPAVLGWVYGAGTFGLLEFLPEDEIDSEVKNNG